VIKVWAKSKSRILKNIRFPTVVAGMPNSVLESSAASKKSSTASKKAVLQARIFFRKKVILLHSKLIAIQASTLM